VGDQPPKTGGFMDRVSESAWWGLYQAIGGSIAVHQINRRILKPMFDWFRDVIEEHVGRR